MKIRVANDQDAEALLELYSVLAGAQAIAGRDAVLQVIAHPSTWIFCAPSSNSLSAMATLHLHPNVTQNGRPYALIENVVTRPDMRGTGCGRAVMQACIDHAWAANAYKIMLMTGRTTSARGFYETLGFVADEKWAMTMRRAPIRRGI